MQMEQTVAEARLEQVYQHYKKSRTQLESELVALTSKDRLRIELLKQVCTFLAFCCMSRLLVLVWAAGHSGLDKSVSFAD
jgi:hypothetical protein